MVGNEHESIILVDLIIQDGLPHPTTYYLTPAES
jgi:hypothetical protein